MRKIALSDTPPADERPILCPAWCHENHADREAKERATAAGMRAEHSCSIAGEHLHEIVNRAPAGLEKVLGQGDRVIRPADEAVSWDISLACAEDPGGANVGPFVRVQLQRYGMDRALVVSLTPGEARNLAGALSRGADVAMYED